MKKKISVAAAAALLLALLAFYLHYENTALTVDRYTVESDRLPAAFDGYTVAHVSDWHMSGSVRLQKALFSALEGAAPDLIAFTGDLINFRLSDQEDALAFMKKLVAIAPVCFVMGNHEAAHPDPDALFEALRGVGVTVLRDTAITVGRGGETIVVAGLRDPRIQFASSITDEAIVRYCLSSMKLDPSRYTVLLSHRPECFEVYVEGGVDLALCGHAHGGQIRLPFLGGLYAPGQGFFPKYTEGLYTKDKTSMLVSRGLGNSRFPFRVNDRPQLLFATLRRGA